MSDYHVAQLFGLAGRAALVVGGARNLGRDMAEALAEAGADVALTSRDFEAAKATSQELARATGRCILPLALDATDEDQVIESFAQVLRQFGRLDVLVNNAGGTVHSGGGFRFVDRTLADFEATMRLNLWSTFLCCREAARAMMEQKQGSIINIASISGMVGRERSVYPGGMRPNQQDYSMAKAGIIGFTYDLAAELGAHGIRVNAISPGGFARSGHDPEFVRRYSAQTMLGRMGTDGLDLKGAVVYLASDAASYVTGHNLVVDGGFTAW